MFFNCLVTIGNFKFQKIVLLLIILNVFFTAITRSNNVKDRELKLKKEANFLGRQDLRSQKRAKNFLEKADCYASQGKWKLAIENYNRTIEINPNFETASKIKLQMIDN